jgi:hypothetical protein
VKHQTISVTEFKAKCLALLDDIVTVTKRGRPLATVGRPKTTSWESPEGMLAGKVKIMGDIVHFPPPGIWDVVREVEEKRR